MTTTTQPAPPADFPAIQIQYKLTKTGRWKVLGNVSTTKAPNVKGWGSWRPTSS